ncbi:hypothetical protein ACFVZ8_20765 [Streptomyces sp. NPDC059558]|uniref:hypothetical protein n=1 Tax=unclassified Streptomyces TaxID=2593676 RepID=UPI00131DEEA8|nr:MULTISPECIES: hypothetical protein [unclassified Streptomyces]
MGGRRLLVELGLRVVLLQLWLLLVVRGIVLLVRRRRWRVRRIQLTRGRGHRV